MAGDDDPPIVIPGPFGELLTLTRTPTQLPQLLTRTPTTLDPLIPLKNWIWQRSNQMREGLKPVEVAEGHALVFGLCTGSSTGPNTEHRCYMFYCECVRALLHGAEPQDCKRTLTAVQALMTVFRYLDQYLTSAKDRPGCRRGKQSQTAGMRRVHKLCAGQKLKAVAEHIARDPLWMPDYQIPQGAPQSSLFSVGSHVPESRSSSSSSRACARWVPKPAAGSQRPAVPRPRPARAPRPSVRLCPVGAPRKSVKQHTKQTGQAEKVNSRVKQDRGARLTMTRHADEYLPPRRTAMMEAAAENCIAADLDRNRTAFNMSELAEAIRSLPDTC